MIKKTYALYPWQHLVIQSIHPIDRGFKPSDLTRLSTNDRKDFTAYIPECCSDLHDVLSRFLVLLREEMPAAKAATDMADNFIHRGGGFNPALFGV